MGEHIISSITQLSTNNPLMTIDRELCSSFGYQQKKLFMRVNIVIKTVEFYIEVNKKIVDVTSDIFEAIKIYNTAIKTYSDLEEK